MFTTFIEYDWNNCQFEYYSSISISIKYGRFDTKIICHACLGIVSFCRGGNGKENSGLPIDDSSYILPYLGDLLNAVATGPLPLDVASNTVVYNRAFASIACLADVAKEDFAPYYDNIIHGLMECVSFGLQRDANGMISASGSTSHETVSLRGSAVEAATIVGQSIGEEDNRFHSEAEKIMNLIVPLHGTPLSLEDIDIHPPRTTPILVE